MRADMAVIPEQYDRACQLEYSGGISSHSHRGADAFWMGLRAAFPSATFRIEHQIGREDNNMPARAALRWSLYGTHDGWGMFGKPTGAQVYVMGMSQAEFGPWGLRREYSLIDETAIWKQNITTHRKSMSNSHPQIVRYGELKPCRTAFIDAHTPGSNQKENFTIIGNGVSESKDQHVHIRQSIGFNTGAAGQPPQCTNSTTQSSHC